MSECTEEEPDEIINNKPIKKKNNTVQYYNRKNFLLKAIQPQSIYDLMAEAFIKQNSQKQEQGVPHFASFEPLGVIIQELKDKIKSYSENGLIHILNLHTVTIADAQNQESFQSAVQKKINSIQKVQKQKNHQINQRRVLVKAWDGNGGYEGLSEWLAYEALCLQSKSIIQLQQWIKNLNSDQVESYLEKFYQKIELQSNQKAVKKQEQIIKKQVTKTNNQDIKIKDQSRRNTLQNSLINHLQSPSRATRKTIFQSPKKRLFSSQSEDMFKQEKAITKNQINSNQNIQSIKTNIRKRRNTIVISPVNKQQNHIFPIHHFQLDSFNSKMHKYNLKNEGIYRKCSSQSIIQRFNVNLENQKHKKNKQLQKLISKGNCHENQFCKQQKMVGVPDIMASLPLPLPFNLQQKFGKELNVNFAQNQEFMQRNMAIEPKEHQIENYNGKIPQGSVRVIATKKALDSWHAQSLGVQLDKYVKKYKEFKQIKQQNEREQAYKFQQQNKPFQNFQQQDSLKDSAKTINKNEKNPQQNKVKEKKKEEIKLQEKVVNYFGRSKQQNIDFNEFINQIRPQNKRNIVPQGREDMKVLPVEAKYNKEKSEVILLAINQKSQTDIKVSKQDKNVSQNVSQIISDSYQEIPKKELAQSNNKQINQWQNIKTKIQNKYQNINSEKKPQQTSDRRYLIQQLGGFKNKKIENLYHKEMREYQDQFLENSKSQMVNKSKGDFKYSKGNVSYQNLKLYNIKQNDLNQGNELLIKQKIDLTNLLIQNKNFNRKLTEERKLKSQLLTKEMRQQKDKQQQWHFTQRATFKKLTTNDQYILSGDSFIQNSNPLLVNNQKSLLNGSPEREIEEENIYKNKVSSVTGSQKPDIYSSSPGSRHKTKRNYSSTTRSKAPTEKDQILNKYDQIENAIVEGKHQQMSAKQFDKFIKKQQLEMNKQASLKFQDINNYESIEDNEYSNKVNINLGLISQTIACQSNLKMQEYEGSQIHMEDLQQDDESNSYQIKQNQNQPMSAQNRDQLNIFQKFAQSQLQIQNSLKLKRHSQVRTAISRNYHYDTSFNYGGESNYILQNQNQENEIQFSNKILSKSHSDIKKYQINKNADNKQNENNQTTSNTKLSSFNINQTATTGILETTVKDTNQSATISLKKIINKHIDRTNSSESLDITQNIGQQRQILSKQQPRQQNQTENKDMLIMSTESNQIIIKTKKLNWNIKASRLQNAKLWANSSFESSKMSIKRPQSSIIKHNEQVMDVQERPLRKFVKKYDTSIYNTQLNSQKNNQNQTQSGSDDNPYFTQNTSVQKQQQDQIQMSTNNIMFQKINDYNNIELKNIQVRNNSFNKFQRNQSSKTIRNMNQSIKSQKYIEPFYSNSLETNVKKSLLQNQNKQLFQNQKQILIQQAIQKQRNQEIVKQNTFTKYIQLQDNQVQQNDNGYNQKLANFELIKLPDDNQAKRKIILDEINEDTELDIVNPFKNNLNDLRIFKIGLKCVDIKPSQSQKNQKVDFYHEDYWFVKGCENFEKRLSTENLDYQRDHLNTAIDCYVQSIRIQPLNAFSIHNLACIYEIQQRFDLAIKWFDISIQIDPNNIQLVDSYFGLSLTYFKSGYSYKAIEKLDIAINMLKGREIQERSMFDKFYFRYLRAICYRVTNNFKSSIEDYESLIKVFNIQEGKVICHQIFAMIIMPLEQKRKKVIQFLDNFKSVIDKYQVDKILKPRYLSKFYLEYVDKQQFFVGENKDKKWVDRKILDVVNILKELSFFKRFNIQRIREMMNEMNLELIPKGKLIFFENDKVYVVVGGSIYMKCHQQKPDLPITYAKFNYGSVLNFMQDENIFNSLETWFVAQVQTEVAVFKKSYFEKLWREEIMTEQLKLRCKQLKCYQLFENLSDLVLISIISEYIQPVRFYKGELMYPMFKYAPSKSMYRMEAQLHEKLFNDKIMNKIFAKEEQEISKSDDSESNNQAQIGLTEKNLINENNFGNNLKKLNQKEIVISHNNLKINLEFDKFQHNESIAIDSSQTQKQVQNQSIFSQYNQAFKSTVTRPSILSVSQLNIDSMINKKEEDVFNIGFGQPDQNQDRIGFYMIVKGRCEVIHKSDLRRACYIQGGDFFGESEILKVVGFDFFGDIYAESDFVDCIFISLNDFHKIPLYEQHTIKEVADKRQSIQFLGYQYSQRYRIDPQEYASYYS